MGPGELVVLLLVAMVVLGPRELPRYARKAGEFAGRAHDWVRDLGDWVRGIEDDRTLAAGAFAVLAVVTIYLIGLAIHSR